MRILESLALLFVAVSPHPQNTRATPYTGRVLTNGQAPVAGATVVLFPAASCDDPAKSFSTRLVVETGDDGSYSFAGVPSEAAWILVYRPGFSPFSGACMQASSSTHFPDVTLYPAFEPSQMPDAQLDALYGPIRTFLTFRAPHFNAQGTSFDFVTLDGYHGGAKQYAWTYNLQENTLRQSVLTNWTESENQVLPGPYQITRERLCRGCADTLIAYPTDPHGKLPSLTLSSNLSLGPVESEDGNAVFWGEINSKGQTIIGMYDLVHRTKRYVIPPWQLVLTLLAVRHMSGGYQLAYSAELACNPSLQQRIDWFLEPYPDNQFAWHRPWRLCFVQLAI